MIAQVYTQQAQDAIASGIPSNELFTPRLKSTGERVVMRVKNQPAQRRGPGFHGLIRDELTGKLYKVYGASCGLDHCYCDALVVEVK